jgi:hypothetical protein
MSPPPVRLIFVALFCGACGNNLANEEGNLAAADTGSIVTDLAPREAPDAELVARCGDGAVDPPALRLRRPFLQIVLHAIDATGREFDHAVLELGAR